MNTGYPSNPSVAYPGQGYPAPPAYQAYATYPPPGVKKMVIKDGNSKTVYKNGHTKTVVRDGCHVTVIKDGEVVKERHRRHIPLGLSATIGLAVARRIANRRRERNGDNHPQTGHHDIGHHHVGHDTIGQHHIGHNPHMAHHHYIGHHHPC